MQAELLAIELTIEDLQRDNELSAYNTSWCYGKSNEIACEVWNKLRCSLDTYYKTLLLTAQVNDLEQVPDDELELLRKWYDEESGGGDWLRGVEAKVFRDKSCHQGLLSLRRMPNKDDCIASLIATKVLPTYDRLIGHRIHRSMSSQQFRGVREYQFKHLVRLASFIHWILSAALPAASILVLASLHSMNSRLVAIILMALVFSAVMTVVAQKKAEVFVAATAFSAILVVWVGSPERGNNKEADPVDLFEKREEQSIPTNAEEDSEEEELVSLPEDGDEEEEEFEDGKKRKAEDDEEGGSKKAKASKADGAEENGENGEDDGEADGADEEEEEDADDDDKPAVKTKDTPSKASESKSSAKEVKAAKEQEA
ncbi:hypothetical protein DV735_g3600, partial [Chaetothyriales sp. CBS 134920]